VEYATELIIQDKAIEKARELFVSGDERGLENVRQEIRGSWQRAKEAGVSPTVQQFPTLLSPDEFESLCRQNLHLLEAGRETIALLSQTLTAESFIAGLVDNKGNLLYSYSPAGNDQRRNINAIPGARIGERLVGTDSSALAMYLDRPFLVYRHEHYAESLGSWVGCAAPIHSFHGDSLGALGIVGHLEIAHPRALDLVSAAVSSIERKIRHFEDLVRFQVLEEFNRYLLKFPDSILLALDAHGRILSLSPPLAKLITLQQPDRLLGRHIQDAYDFHCEKLRLPMADPASEPYESTIVFPRKEKGCSGTAIPIFREGHPAGLVVIASGLAQPVSKKVAKPVWQAAHTFHALIGRSPAFYHAIQAAEKAAEYSWPVLLVGESGTGKELFAQAIHRASRHTGGPFVAINCSAIPKELAASELFGYEDGAFSGALRGGQPGKIELAHRGTLFLDEIADMPAEIQASLLRVLEEGKVVPLGSKRPREVDVRIIAALNTDPQAAVTQGKLRLDLYHRLNVFPIVLPPLRERVEDLSLLARHLLDREGFADIEIAPEVFEVFRNHAWPGNIRELRNVLVRAALLASDQMITPKHLPPELSRHSAAPLLPVSSARRETGEQLHSPSRQVDQAQLQQAFKACGGTIAHAAKRLGIHKATFYRKLQQYGLTREDLEASGPPAQGSTLSSAFTGG
jgi:transcriptional regulator of acetoin/glycerol metabolism